MVNNDDDFLKSLLGGLKKLEPKPTPTRPAPSIYTRPDLENILRQAGWPEEHVPYMTEMALKESSGNPGATRVRRAGEGQRLPESSYGLWQINTLAHPQYDPQKLATDPVYNAKAALDVYKKQGFDAWLKSKRKLAAQGILPGQVKASAPAAPATVSDDEFRAHLESLISPASPEVDDNFKQKIETLITGTSPTPTNPASGYAPVSTNTLDNASIPSNRPALQPRKNRAAAPIKAKPKAPVGEGTVTVDVGNLTPIDTSAGQFVDTGVQVDLPRQAGKATDSNGIAAKVTVNVQGVPTAEKLDYSIRKAYESVATKFDLTPDQIEQGIKLGRQYKVRGRIDDDTTAGTIWITLEDLENIKGKDVAQTDERMRQAQSRVGIEQIPPENLLTPEVINALKASTITPTEALETPWFGMEDEQNVIAGALRSGGSAWRALAGLYRAADDLWHRPFGEGHRLINPSKFEDIKAYQGDDIYKYMSSIAATSEAPAEKLAKYGGTRAEIFQMAGALPGDLSRIMLLSKLPGGMVTGMSADMAAQSAGRGEHFDRVVSEAFKGALFGSIAKYAGPVGEKWMAWLDEAGFSSAASKLWGGAATVAFTGAATYPVSRAFGADPKTALKETIFTTIFSLGDAAPVLAGRTVRAKDPAGNEVAFQIDPHGNAKEVQVPKGEVADVEIYDQYQELKNKASKILSSELKRPLSERLAEAKFTVEGPETIAANPQATSILNYLLAKMRASEGKPPIEFHGIPLTGGDAGVFVRHLENMLDEAQRAGNGGDMVNISNLISNLKDAVIRTGGRAALYTKYGEGLEPISEGTRVEETVHLRNELAGIKAVAEAIAEKPAIQKVLENLNSVYKDKALPVQVDEAVAQSFRPRAEEHLRLSKQEIRRAQKELYEALEQIEDFDEVRYAESLEGISRRGDVLARYARQKQRSKLSGERGIEDVAGRTDTVDPNVRGVPEVPGRGAGDSTGHLGRDTGGIPERGQFQARAAEAPREPVNSPDRFDPPMAVAERDESRARATQAIAELENLKENGMPTKEGIAAILGVDDHPYGRSVSAAIYDLKEHLEEGAPSPLGDKRAWNPEPVIEQAPVPELQLKKGTEGLNSEIYNQVTAPKQKKYKPDPAAVERGSVLEDGKIWVQGQQVFPTDESVAVVRAMAEHNNALITEKLKELDQLKRSGQVTREQLDSVIGEDHRFGTDVDAAIRDYESVLLDNGMYLQDIAEANTAYNTYQVAKQVKTKAPKESTPKAKEPSTPVAKEDPWSVQAREAHLAQVQAINKKLGIKEWQPPAKPDPNIEAWKQRQRLAELSDTRPAADKTVDEIVDRDVRQAYKDAGGDQFKAVEEVLKRYEQDAINMQSSGSALFQKKIEALRNKYGPIIEFNKRRASGGSVDPPMATVKKVEEDLTDFVESNFPGVKPRPLTAGEIASSKTGPTMANIIYERAIRDVVGAEKYDLIRELDKASKVAAERVARGIPIRRSRTIRYKGDSTPWLEVPTANAVEALDNAGVRTVSSGYHHSITKDLVGVDPNYTIIMHGEPGPKVRKIAEDLGLKIARHKLDEFANTYYLHSEGLGKADQAKAKALFDTFADRLNSTTLDPPFAAAFKDNKIFDKKTQNEVVEFGEDHFPEVFSMWSRKSSGPPIVTNPNPTAAERVAKARGMDVETSPQKIADRIVNIYREFKRQFKEIDPNESVQMARTADSFRLLSSLNSWAKTQATNDVARIVKPLSREQYDVFENVLILRDKKKAVEQGMKPGHGYIDLADVEKSLKEYEDAAKADPAISKALADREALRRKTVGDLVKIDMLGKRALDNDSYFHRQVPQGGENNLFLSMGNRDLRVRKKGFEKKRTGEGDDYNTNYVEAEVEWLSQAHAQIRKHELLQEIKRAVDISDDLKLQAKIQGVDWHTLVDKSTHRIWQPQEGSYFYKVMSAPDELLTDIFSGKHTLSTAEAELREALARGQKKPEWVLPSGVAKLMDDFEVQPHENAIKQTTANAMASWKQWELINPKNYLSYNIRNFISDLDAAMAYPGIIKELPAAIKDIYKYSRDKNHAAAAEIEQAIKDGVMDSGQTFAEIPDISKLGVFKIFADSDTNVLSRGLNKVWDAMKNSSNARENWIRLAAYRHIKQRLANGDVIYGASNRGQVDALAGNPGRQAAKIARELVGDYGGISEAGRAIRKHAIPFYSWMEINAPRYVRMIHNIPNEAGGKSRLAGMAGTKVAGKIALVGTKRAVQLMAITAAINVWNHLVFPDLEDQLMKTDVGKRPHLIVGTNPDGTARVFQADTALRDAMDWFDAGDIVSDISEVRDGRATVIDKIAEGVKAPVNRVVQALGPYKTAGEFVFGESTYPDIFEKGTSFALKSRPIRDRAEYLAQAFAVKGIYQRVMGRPTPPASGPIGQLSDWFLTMRVDPEESIFWNIRGRVSDYKKKMGKSTGGTDPTEKSNTLFYYKQAIRWGNQEAAERYLKQYKEEFGGTDKGLQQSLDRTHPLGQLAKSDWPEFIKQLTPDERDQLKVAIGYYDEKFKNGPGATPAKDTTVEELLQMTFPGKDQEGIDRMVEAERRKEQADAQREANKKARGLR